MFPSSRLSDNRCMAAPPPVSPFESLSLERSSTVDRVVEDDGSFSWRRSPGGLVTAVEPVMQRKRVLPPAQSGAGAPLSKRSAVHPGGMTAMPQQQVAV